MLGRGLAPKTVRNVMTFLHAVFALALANEWIERNPVAGAARPKRRRQGDANPDLQFLTIEQLDRVLAEIPDEVVAATPAPTRRGRPGPAPPPPPDVLGPVLRVLILAAAFTGLRQSELIGLRWRDVDLESQRIRVRNAVVRGEHSGEGKSDLSTRRSVPMAERLRAELERWHERTVFGARRRSRLRATRSSGRRWIAPRSRAGSRPRADAPACRRSASTTFATRSRPSSRRPACHCARSRSSSATRTSRRRRSTRTTHAAPGSWTWSTRRSGLATARSRRSAQQLDCGNGALIGLTGVTRLLTVDEVAERLGVTRDWVWAQARAGRIPHVQLGRYRRFREETLEAWLADLEQRGTAAPQGDGRAGNKSRNEGVAGSSPAWGGPQRNPDRSTALCRRADNSDALVQVRTPSSLRTDSAPRRQSCGHNDVSGTLQGNTSVFLSGRRVSSDAMTLTAEEVTQRLRQAKEAVEAAGLPDGLREVGFSKAFDALTGVAVPPAGALPGGGQASGGANTSGGGAATMDAGSMLGKIAAKLQIDEAQVGYLFEEDGEELHFVGRRFLPTAKRDAQPAAMLLLAAGRQAAGLDDFTLVSHGRELAQDLGIIDKNTWLPQIKAMGDLVRRKGEGQKFAVKLTQAGWDEVRRRVGENARRRDAIATSFGLTVQACRAHPHGRSPYFRLRSDGSPPAGRTSKR